MNLVGRLPRVFRRWKRRHGSHDADDTAEQLIQSSSHGVGPRAADQRIVLSRWTRRVTLASCVRCVLIGVIVAYLSMICTPISDLQSFVPTDVRRARNFLLVVAHPDDECLFFGPTIIGLIAHSKTVHLLVLSTGNNEGLGPQRQRELNGSCQRLGIDGSRCLAVNVSDLQDDPRRWWPKQTIRRTVETYVNRFRIDLLITFDRGGITGHINHRSIAAAFAIRSAVDNGQSLLVYELSTHPLVLEFSSLLNLMPTLLRFAPRLCRSFFSTVLPFVVASPSNEHVLFVSSPSAYWRTVRAFHSHRSQLLFNRHLHATFSSHMFINHLRRIA
jgi:N-acetylglucosaminylphosphatidylinositol deacetylase